MRDHARQEGLNTRQGGFDICVDLQLSGIEPLLFLDKSCDALVHLMLGCQHAGQPFHDRFMLPKALFVRVIGHVCSPRPSRAAAMSSPTRHACATYTPFLHVGKATPRHVLMSFRPSSFCGVPGVPEATITRNGAEQHCMHPGTLSHPPRYSSRTLPAT